MNASDSECREGATADMGVLDGLRVVEHAAWVAGPSAGALLADWGAEVWKVEPPRGDPFRAIITSQGYSADIPNAPFTVDNRGKRSIVLDLRTVEGQTAMECLLSAADVFITNMRVKSLARSGLTPDTVAERHPALVIGLITGYGLRGPDKARAGYDVGAFAARSGILHQMRAGSAPPGPLPLGFGDHVVGLATAAGVLGALIERARTGRGQIVETNLLRTGTFTLGWELGTQLLLGRVPGGVDRSRSKTPLVNCYRSQDDHWFWLLGVEADRHFPSLMWAIDRDDLPNDPRFATARDRRRNNDSFIQELDKAFGDKPMSFWQERFDDCGVWWAPVQTPDEVVADDQAQAAGCFVDVEGADFQTVANPVEFTYRPTKSVTAAPALGADTEAVLRQAGCPEDVIAGVTSTRR
jgi:crotonobetainyl-CoA:carnitine CoA-transferase CaiB-like acyl-CoA transferase